MIYDHNADVRDFHLAAGLPVNDGVPAVPPPGLVALRRSLVEEEAKEVLEAIDANDVEDIAKELADLVYIAYGTAITYGIPLDKVLREVHRSNMTKVVDGEVLRREDGKILKPESYEPADVESVLKEVS